MKKIIIMLGAYIDSVNAQDINCYFIAKYLNKRKFEVHALKRTKTFNMPDVHTHFVSSNRIKNKIDKFSLLKLINADVYYLPRVEKTDILFAYLYGKKKCIISSIEIQNVYSNRVYHNFFNTYIYDYFCISKFLQNLNIKYWGRKPALLYLGVECFNNIPRYREKLNNIIFVGSIEQRKRPDAFVRIASQFPELNFKMIGDGSLLKNIEDEAYQNCVQNIRFLGRLENSKVLNEMMSADLLLVLSEKEGLPKVVLEAASVGVPTIYENRNYSIDYIVNGVNGYGVESDNDVIKKIKLLEKNQETFRMLSKNAFDEAKIYTWDKLIIEWEDYFIDTNNDFCHSMKSNVRKNKG